MLYRNMLQQVNLSWLHSPVWSLALRRVSVTELSKSLYLKAGIVCRPHWGSPTN